MTFVAVAWQWREHIFETHPLTPSDRWESAADTGEVVKVEGKAVAAPGVKSASGEPLAFQEILNLQGRTIPPLVKWPPARATPPLVKWVPAMIAVENNGKTLWLDAGDLEQMQPLAGNQNRGERHIAIALASYYQPSSSVWTIRPGEHLQAAGRIVRDKYGSLILKAPDWPSAPFLREHIRMRTDKGVRTF